MCGKVTAQCNYCEDHEVKQENLTSEEKEAGLLIVLNAMKDHIKQEHPEKRKENTEHYTYTVTGFN